MGPAEDHKTITVIIPTLNAEGQLPALLSRIHSQSLRPEEIIVVDSASGDRTEQICRDDESVTYIRIKRSEYDHGGTRDMAARKASGDIVVFLTQDALPADDEFLRNLTAPVARGEAAICTGRQLPRRGATHMEALVREFNYPAVSFIRSKDDIPRLGIKTFFCSDVCCAYDREIYLRLGGFEHPIKTNEDMFFAAKAINSGYKIAYAADARVYHSHNFSLRQQFERNYIQGYEIARHSGLLNGVPLEGEGMRLVRSVSSGLIKQGHALALPRFAADCAARLAGSRFGRLAYSRDAAKGQNPAAESTAAAESQEQKQPAVCVLMSTYNGEKYLRQQIDSLYAQKGVDLTITARDDGSTDSTLQILDKNTAEHGCFSWYANGHLGSARSFLDLIDRSPDADYYALCDQDDVWDDDKLKSAVDMLEETDSNRPALYYSNLRVVDEDLSFHRNAHSRPWVMKSRYSALADVAATGCTMVFNKALRDLLKARMPEACKMHDEWIFLVCSFFGTVVYDFEPHISYRQHGSNVLGTHLDGYSLKWLRQKVSRTAEKSWLPRSVNAKSLRDAYGDMLTKKELRRVSKAADYRGSVKSRLALLADPRIHGRSLKTDIRYRIKVITGKA